MRSRKVDWVVDEWNKEIELPEEIKKVMYNLYRIDCVGKDGYDYNDFFDLDLSFVGKRKTYYKKAIILLRKDKIEKLKGKING